MIIISSSMQLTPRLEYTLDTIFRHFLGLTWRFEQSAEESLHIRLRGHKGHIEIPKNELLFDQNEILKVSSYVNWDIAEIKGEVHLSERAVPVVFSAPEFTFIQTEHYVRLPLDILGITFFMLSRIEESWDQTKDAHNRFAVKHALAERLGLLYRPLVDEYTEILRSAMDWLWPALKLETFRKGRINVSCDVDRPISVEKKMLNILKNMRRGILQDGDVKMSFIQAVKAIRARMSDMSNDQYLANIRTIMALNEDAGNVVTFFFMAGSNHSLDGDCWIDHPAVRAVLKEIDDRGHIIGLHPSYLTTSNSLLLAEETEKLSRILEMEKINKPLNACRQHYLRWLPAETPYALQKAGFKNDATLGFPEKPGFRCGTAKQFPLYDLKFEKTLEIIETPLHFMDSTINGTSYLNLGFSPEALGLLNEIRERAIISGGSFSFLWHNCSFDGDPSLAFYKKAIS